MIFRLHDISLHGITRRAHRKATGRHERQRRMFESRKDVVKLKTHPIIII
jgi:hypothetical protein